MNISVDSAIRLHELIDMVGARLDTVVRMGTTDADTVLFRTLMPPGKIVPLHSHIDPECFYVLAGSIEIFRVDDMPNWQTLATGQSLLLANGMKHSIRNMEKQPADLIVATNGRLARYFREAGRVAAPGSNIVPPTSDDIQHMIRVTKSFGYWLSSPEESAAITG